MTSRTLPLAEPGPARQEDGREEEEIFPGIYPVMGIAMEQNKR
jgi:hypothetical protein